MFIIGHRLLHGEGPPVRQVWRKLWPNTPIPREGAYGALIHMAQFGVYWKPDTTKDGPAPPGCIWVQRSVYEAFRPQVVAALTAAGLYPRRRPYRGHKGPAK